MDKRLYEIDILRSFSIILILLHHLDNYTNNDIFLVLKPYLGIFGLSLFVFLSGYSININNKSFINYIDIFLFYKKRIKRIYPLYILAVIIFFILFQIVGQVIIYDLYWWIIQLLGLEILLSPNFVNPIFTLWFIGMLLLYYLIYPFLLFKSIKPDDILFKSFLILLLFIIIRIIFNIIDIRFFVYYFIFIAGILTSRFNLFYVKRYQSIFLIASISFLIILAIHLLTGSYSIYEGPNTIGEFSDISIYNAIGLLIILDLLMLTFVLSITYFTTWIVKYQLKNQSKKFIIKFAVFGAFASYAVYLFHRPYFSVIYYPMLMMKINYVLIDIIIYIIALPLLFIISYYIQKYTNLLLN